MDKRIIEKIMRKIVKLTKNTQYKISKSDYEVNDRGCPHQSSEQAIKTEDDVAVYIFIYVNENNKVLKIGKAKYNDRIKQHYHVNGNTSTLAKSLFNDPQSKVHNKDETYIKNWMQNNLQRIDIIIKDSCKDQGAVKSLIETILHYYFRPTYEGDLK